MFCHNQNRGNVRDKIRQIKELHFNGPAAVIVLELWFPILNLRLKSVEMLCTV